MFLWTGQVQRSTYIYFLSSSVHEQYLKDLEGRIGLLCSHETLRPSEECECGRHPRRNKVVQEGCEP